MQIESVVRLYQSNPPGQIQVIQLHLVIVQKQRHDALPTVLVHDWHTLSVKNAFEYVGNVVFTYVCEINCTAIHILHSNGADWESVAVLVSKLK